MPNTYGDIYVQVVFAVKYRRKLIDKSWKDELNKYITGIINRKGVKPLIVNAAEEIACCGCGFGAGCKT